MSSIFVRGICKFIPLNKVYGYAKNIKIAYIYVELIRKNFLTHVYCYLALNQAPVKLFVQVLAKLF